MPAPRITRTRVTVSNNRQTLMGMPTRHRRVFLPISDAGRFPARWERILAEVPIFTTFMYTSKFSFAFVCPNSVPTPITDINLALNMYFAFDNQC